MPTPEPTDPGITIEPLIVTPLESKPASDEPVSSIAAAPTVYEFEPSPENQSLEERDC